MLSKSSLLNSIVISSVSSYCRVYWQYSLSLLLKRLTYLDIRVYYSGVRFKSPSWILLIWFIRNSLSLMSLCNYLSLLLLMISPRKIICSFLMKVGSKEISLFIIIQSPRSLFLLQMARNIGLIRDALELSKTASLSKAFLILSIIASYSDIISNASVNSLEKNFESTSKEFSFCRSIRYE